MDEHGQIYFDNEDEIPDADKIRLNAALLKLEFEKELARVRDNEPKE